MSSVNTITSSNPVCNHSHHVTTPRRSGRGNVGIRGAKEKANESIRKRNKSKEKK
jgi:hypothetical protein